jgi:hypothetical protein
MPEKQTYAVEIQHRPIRLGKLAIEPFLNKYEIKLKASPPGLPGVFVDSYTRINLMS